MTIIIHFLQKNIRRVSRNFLRTSSLVFIIFTIVTLQHVSAAEIIIKAPSNALANRQPITVEVILDQEEDVISGISADFSFPSDMFTVGSIQTKDSIVSLWVKQPGVSLEKYFDDRTHITFEGIFPGGYEGVLSPYYKGKKPGVIVSVTLIPKNKGIGSLIVDNITLNRYDSEATPIETASAIKTIIVPELLPIVPTFFSESTEVKSPTLEAFITRDALVNNNAWYVVVNEREEKSAVEEMLIAETDDYNARLVSSGKWRSAKNPYVLLYQDRTKFVHIKILYTNNTYALLTLPPVENSKSISGISRILIGIIIVLSLLYFYASSHLAFYKKR